MEALKIIELRASNFKRLTAVEVKPQRDAIVVAGPNGAGKSSVLDAITAALCGKKACPPMPIRQGQEEAEIVIDLGQFVVKRTFTAKGSYLTITAGDMKAGKPQELLDKIVGQIAFDPMAFIRMNAADQRKTLMDLVGLRTDDLDDQIAKAREAKNAAAAEKTRLLHHLESMDSLPEDTPDADVSAAEIVEELTRAKEHNLCVGKLRDELAQAITRRNDQQTMVKYWRDRVKSLEAELASVRDSLAKAVASAEEAEEWQTKAHVAVETFEPIDTAPLEQKLAEVEETNRCVQAKRIRQGFRNKLQEVEDQRRAATKHQKKYEDEKVERLKAVPWPVPGLAVTDEHVTYEGVPLEQVNTSAQIRIGLAVAMAMNPKLRVIRMSGNDLDEHTLAAIAEQAGEQGYQLWIERIEDPTHMGILLEDGAVVDG